jgi:hypothetical protein
MGIKKGSISLSINAIIIIILAVVMLGLGLTFIRGSFSKTSAQLEQQLATENEPPTPDSSNPITFSREVIKTQSKATEIIKISVYNPTNLNWDRRGSLNEFYIGCGQADNICDKHTYCTSEQIAGDIDCSSDPVCDDVIDGTSDGYCVVSETCEYPNDQDCLYGLVPGVDLLFVCDNELQIISRSIPKVINVGDYETFSSVIKIKKGIQGTFLCNIKVLGQDEETNEIQGYEKDLTIEVE